MKSYLRIAGVDDAGRGAIIGPMVIAGVLVPEEKLETFSSIGVKDSKLLSPMTRSRLYREITRIASQVAIRKVSPTEIDEYVLRRKKFRRLNYLEAVTMASIVDELKPEIVYVDSSDTDEERFKTQVEEASEWKTEVVSVHHADQLYVVVSAASIVAKYVRDSEVEELKTRYGEFGSGYPSDPITRQFLNEWIRKHGEKPVFARASWKTWKKLTSDTLR